MAGTCGRCAFADALPHPAFVLTADNRVRGVSLRCARFGWLAAHNAGCNEYESRDALEGAAGRAGSAPSTSGKSSGFGPENGGSNPSGAMRTDLERLALELPTWASAVRVGLGDVRGGLRKMSGDFSGGVLHREASPTRANPHEVPSESP